MTLQSVGYLVDVQTDTVHIRGCDLVGWHTVFWDNFHLGEVLGKKRICPVCCKSDYRAKIRAKNEDIIRRSRFEFFAVKGSKVFHKKTCGLALSSLEIVGYGTFKGAEKSGHCPCKKCRPVPSSVAVKPVRTATHSDLEGIVPPALMQEFGLSSDCLNRQEKLALRRFYRAREERRLLGDGITPKQMLLTQTSFSFWAGVGCSTFHVESCHKLMGLNQLKGFSNYRQATQGTVRPFLFRWTVGL